MKRLLEALKNVAWDAVCANGTKSVNSTRAEDLINEIEADEALFNRQYAVMGLRPASNYGGTAWMALAVFDTAKDARSFIGDGPTKNKDGIYLQEHYLYSTRVFCQEILTPATPEE